MLDNEPTGGEQTGTVPASEATHAETQTTAAPARRARTTRRRAASGASADADSPDAGAADAEPTGTGRAKARAKATADTGGTAVAETDAPGTEAAGAPAPARRTRSRKATAAAKASRASGEQTSADVAQADSGAAPAEPEAGGEAGEKSSRRTRRTRTARTAAGESVAIAAPQSAEPVAVAPAESGPAERAGRRRAPAATVLFMAPQAIEHAPAAPAGSSEPVPAPAAEPQEGRPARRRRGRRSAEAEESATAEQLPAEDLHEAPGEPEAEAEEPDEAEDEDAAGRRRRRRGRRGRGRGKGNGDDAYDEDEHPEDAEEESEGGEPGEAEGEAVTRRRRRRRRGGAGEAETTSEDGVVTVVKVRPPRAHRDEVQGVSGSTRLEAKRQRRRDGRDSRRTRPPILSESEFLARREAVDRSMVVRERGDRTQIAVLEDGILVEHYVTRASAGSMVGNVYLGKVQNVLPSMEAAFVDIGRGRNAVLYAGEVNWDATGLEGRARSIEQALKAGDAVLVQVTKDPIGHKGARLTSHIALSGRHLVYVPHGNASGISRKLPDTERKRLRDILKSLVPDGAGVIVRTAAEGASEDDLARDVNRLRAQWDDIQAKAAAGGAPVALYEEPDLVIRVVRDLFNEDFRELVIEGGDVYDTVALYLTHVSPDLVGRLRRHTGTVDAFVEHRIDEQILKGLDRKVYLPSGGYLVIDRTEAMTVIDVNTGKYTGTGGNLEETVTRNNLEAAEEIVRQLRLRDLGGIIVIDFIDMVLESNRELVLRRLTECLGRDRTKHQVTEITSLGLVQMTRKRIGQGLLEAFSETCEHCKGRGLLIHTEPVPEKKTATKAAAAVAAAPEPATTGRRRGRKAAEPATEEAATPRRRRGGGAAAEAERVADELMDTMPGTGDGPPGVGLAGSDAVATGDDLADLGNDELGNGDLATGDDGDPGAPVLDEAEIEAVGDDEGDEGAGDGHGGRRRGRRGGGRRRTRASAAPDVSRAPGMA